MALLHDTSMADFLLIRPNLLCMQYDQNCKVVSQIRLTHTHELTQDDRTAFIFQGMYIL